MLPGTEPTASVMAWICAATSATCARIFGSASPARIGAPSPRHERFSAGAAEALAHENAVVAGRAAAAGLLEAESLIERDVLGHLFVRVESHFGIAEAARLGFAEGDQPTPDSLALPVGADRDGVDQQ